MKELIKQMVAEVLAGENPVVYKKTVQRGTLNPVLAIPSEKEMVS